MIRTITSCLTLLALMLSAGCGDQSAGILVATIASSDEHGTYVAKEGNRSVKAVLGAGEGAEYSLHEMHRMDSFEFQGQGSFKELQGKQEQPTVHNPGESTEGLDLLYYFYKTTDDRFIIRQVMKGMSIEGEINIDIKAEVEITEGTWDDYRSGETITAMFTESGLDEYYAVAQEQAEKLIQLLSQSQDPSLRMEFEFEWENKPNYSFELSLKEMTYKAEGESKLTMTMKAYK